MKKLTSFTHHITAEGDRISYTYSVIDDDTGNLTEQNTRGNFIVLDDELQEHLDAIDEYITENKLGS